MIIPYFQGQQPQQPQPAPGVDVAHDFQFPDIVTWCRYLDAHANRNQDGIKFVPYGQILKNQGFTRLSVLDKDYFSVRDLAEWLGVGNKIGIALQIMQYAKADIDAIKARKLFIPSIPDP